MAKERCLKNGGEAFPLNVEYIDEDGNEISGHFGMSLRDYFAAKALVGILTHNLDYGRPTSETATSAYKYADAMIKERNK